MPEAATNTLFPYGYSVLNGRGHSDFSCLGWKSMHARFGYAHATHMHDASCTHMHDHELCACLTESTIALTHGRPHSRSFSSYGSGGLP